MGIPGALLKQFQQALIGAFPSYDTLSQFVTFELNENLPAIAGNGSLKDVVFELLRWLEARDRLEETLSAARKANPTNNELKALEQLYAAWKGGAVNPPPQPPISPQKLTLEQKQQLVDALLECLWMSDNRRNTIWASLPDTLKNNIPRSNVPFEDVTNFVNTALSYPDGLKTLVETVRQFEGDSLPMRAVNQLMATLKR